MSTLPVSFRTRCLIASSKAADTGFNSFAAALVALGTNSGRSSLGARASGVPFGRSPAAPIQFPAADSAAHDTGGAESRAEVGGGRKLSGAIEAAFQASDHKSVAVSINRDAPARPAPESFSRA